MEYYIIELERKLANKLYQYHRYGGRKNLRKIIKLQSELYKLTGSATPIVI